MSFNIVLLVVVLALIQAASAQDAYAQRMLAATNKFRAQNGKPALCFNSKLQQAAQEVADDNVRCGRLGHDTCNKLPDGKANNMVNRVNYFGYKWRSISENVASPGTSLEQIENVIQRWANSPGHRKNMLGDNPQTGMAYSCKSRGKDCYMSQVFAKSNTEKCSSGSTKPPATKPPATKPPATKPPATKPPAPKPSFRVSVNKYPGNATPYDAILNTSNSNFCPDTCKTQRRCDGVLLLSVQGNNYCYFYEMSNQSEKQLYDLSGYQNIAYHAKL
eukprot:Awhi_evm1s8990